VRATSEFQLRSRNALTSHENRKAGRRLAVERTQEHFSMAISTLFSKGRPMLANEVIDVDVA
jgi:hypothetical protein